MTVTVIEWDNGCVRTAESFDAVVGRWERALVREEEGVLVHVTDTANTPWRFHPLTICAVHPEETYDGS